MTKLPIEYSEVGQLYRHTIGEGLSIIALTASDKEEGKSLITETLAKRSAASGQKTLIVDLDLAHSCLHQRLKLEQLDWYPNQEEELPYQETNTENLWFLSAPLKNAHRWEFRDQNALLNCLNKMRTSFDAILIDTSPLSKKNQGNVPPETLCACADGTLLCVLSGMVSETKIHDAYDLLTSMNANIHGAVLNDRFSPSLLSELIREVQRLERFFPRLSRKLQTMLQNSTLLNQDI